MGIKFDPEKCHGCKYCELACSAKHEKIFNPSKARLTVICRYNKGSITVRGHICIQCKICMKICPTDAIEFTDGHMTLDEDKCIACGECATKCPQKCIAMTDVKALICDTCEGDPECVKFCPHGALTY